MSYICSSKFSVDIGSTESFSRTGQKPTITVNSRGHAIHVFVNGQLSGMRSYFLHNLINKIPVRVNDVNNNGKLSMLMSVPLPISTFLLKAICYNMWLSARLRQRELNCWHDISVMDIQRPWQFLIIYHCRICLWNQRECKIYFHWNFEPSFWNKYNCSTQHSSWTTG